MRKIIAVPKAEVALKRLMSGEFKTYQEASDFIIGKDVHDFVKDIYRSVENDPV